MLHRQDFARTLHSIVVGHELQAKVPVLAQRSNSLNAPGQWHFMISYTQQDLKAQALAQRLSSSLKGGGFTVWLDVEMDAKGVPAMKEGVENSMVVLAVITGTGPDDKSGAHPGGLRIHSARIEPPLKMRLTAYFKRDFCLMELRHAFDKEKHVQPVILQEDKTRVGEFVSMAPDDLKKVQDIDFVDVCSA